MIKLYYFRREIHSEQNKLNSMNNRCIWAIGNMSVFHKTGKQSVFIYSVQIDCQFNLNLNLIMEEPQARQRKCERCNRRVNVCNYELHLTKCKLKEPKPSRKEAREAKKREEEAARIARQERGEQAPEEKFPCYNCGYEQTLAELDTHPRRCPNRDTTCNYCAQKYPYGIIRNHYEVCERRPRVAPQSPPSAPASNVPVSMPNPQARNSATVVIPNRINRISPFANIFSNQPEPSENRQESVSNAPNSRSQSVAVQPRPNRPESAQDSSRNVPNSQGIIANGRSRVNPPRPQPNIFTNSAESHNYTNVFSPRASNNPVRQQDQANMNAARRNRFQMFEQEASRNRVAEEVNRLMLAQQLASRHAAHLAQQLAARHMTKKEEGIPRALIKMIPEKKFEACGEEEELCSICCNEFEQEDDLKDLKCKHNFHVKCISDWLCINRSCPLCKCDLSVNIRHREEKKVERNPKKNVKFDSEEARLQAYMACLEEDEMEYDE